MLNFKNLFSDPLITISIIIASVSTFLIIVLGYYYKRLKEKQIIDETFQAEQVKEKKQPKSSSEESNFTDKFSKPAISQQNYEIIIAHLNELSSQLNNLTSYVKDLNSVVNSFKNTKVSDEVEGYSISPDIISRLINTLEKLQQEISNLKNKTENSSSSLEEINIKLDNLLKLLSTILQQ
ncbi:MAG: hypothetical protein RMJ67_02935 [Elusimicrobiota bacterium]|nr:hypothetical protein [Endomicrobiia bacterium]MDW8165452.1 hypothetical protein [Elusimicrobiota bacterium]